MPRIRLKPSVSLLPTRAGVLARTDLATFQIAGADAGGFVSHVAPLLDGSSDAEGIASALGEYSRASVLALLANLSARGLVEEVPDRQRPEPRRGGDELFRKVGVDPAAAAKRLAEARVLVLGGGRVGAVIAAELSAGGVGEARAREAIGEGESFGLLVGCSMDPAEIARASRVAHEAGAMSLWAQISGATALLGPLVVPGQTACRVCASSGPGVLNPALEGRTEPDEAAVAVEGVLAHIAATEAIAVLAGLAPSVLGGRVWAFDASTCEATLHTLVRIPWCTVCG